MSSFDELMGMCFMLQSGLFDLYGHANLSALYAQLHLRNRNPGSPDDGCGAYCTLAAHHFAAGELGIAKEFLTEARLTYPPGTPASQLWRATETQLEYHSAVLQEDWASAEMLERTVSGGRFYGSTADAGAVLPAGDVVVQVDAGFRRALLHLARRQFDCAAIVVSAALGAIEADLAAPKPYLPLARVKQARLARILAEIHHAAENHTVAMVTVAGCITLAQEHGLGLELAAARSLYADVLLALGRVGAARRMLHRALPVVLGHGALEEKGKVHLVHGKCALAVARGEHAGLRAAVASFDKARGAFRKLGARALERRALYLLARTHDALGDTDQRDAAAVAFAALMPAQR
jgi:tetratricopeptide (TPR) repeat protein